MHCCSPQREPHESAAAETPPEPQPLSLSGPTSSTGQTAPCCQDDVGESPSLLRGHNEAIIPAGTFLMGDAFGEGYPADGEVPVHPVRMDEFTIDRFAITNAQFARFVETSGYRTDSEKYGSSAVFHLAFRGQERELLGPVEGVPWWLNVRGASWRHPAGSDSDYRDLLDHPVVHISHFDALAYCDWAERALPTEAQWEYMARGGLTEARFAWGNELQPDGEHRCNIWQGDFPTVNTLDDGYLTTAPVDSFPANGFGIAQSAGNVWEWCSDWFLPKYYATCARQGTVENPTGPTIGDGRVMRGGSYLCHDSYCNRYRVAARSHNSPDSASGNLGFRTVAMKNTAAE